MKETQTILSPVGIAVFPSLIVADRYYAESADDPGYYQTKLRVSPSEGEEMQDKLEEMYQDFRRAGKLKDSKSRPWEMETEEDGEETGHVLLKFKTREFNVRKSDGKVFHSRIGFIDGNKNLLNTDDLDIGSGSTIRIKAEVYMRDHKGKAFISLQPRIVQVIRAVESVGGNGTDSIDEFDVIEDADEIAGTVDASDF